jgi:hypothetical protein
MGVYSELRDFILAHRALSAAHRDEHSRVQPQKHVTAQAVIIPTRSHDPPAAGATGGSSGRAPSQSEIDR